ncbi:ACT domain-containing protein [Anaerotignum propionicum]|jgi:hypothetical protein|uniref:ACT domain-containing protein n=1 Tax=Anaerotignum propionicum TaxID=28446 RepID=UPI002898FE2A|nr:ACT domain-containing protein [Anaerotignum propionicum]
MLLEWLNIDFSVAKWIEAHEIMDLGCFSFWSRTDHELSLVCPTALLPKDAEVREDGWCCFRIVGQMEFSMVGILAKISACLAEREISIFAVSTFDTDYVFIKKEKSHGAQVALEALGYSFVEKM